MNEQKKFREFYREATGKPHAYVLVYNCDTKHFISINYGTGDNLLHEDIEAGYDDYIMVTVSEFDGNSFDEDINGSQLMLKMSEWNNHYNIMQHLDDALDMI